MELLANSLRPTKLRDIVGEDHLVGKDGVITNLVKNKKLFSMILWGNPGTGKTSIAYAIINEVDIPYRFLNATINNKADINIVIEEAKMNNGMILVMDEIHRLDKGKQDLLLPVIESGLIILIGMTTSNPYYSINPAIRSRVMLFEVKPLDNKSIVKILKKACKNLKDVKISSKALDYISNLSSGDARSALNILEMAYYSSKTKKLDIEDISLISSKPVMFTDKNGNGHYELLSALQKSIRGSDVNASIYYLAMLLNIGDLDSIFRRLSVIAYEDIGLANSSIGPKLHAAIEAVKLVGMPEGRIPLSSVVIEMALSPKSNSSITAIDKALSDIASGKVGSVPKHINSEMNPLYKYPHNYPKYWVKQQYLPDEVKDAVYYTPKLNKYEMGLKKLDEERRK